MSEKLCTHCKRPLKYNFVCCAAAFALEADLQSAREQIKGQAGHIEGLQKELTRTREELEIAKAEINKQKLYDIVAGKMEVQRDAWKDLAEKARDTLSFLSTMPLKASRIAEYRQIAKESLTAFDQMSPETGEGKR